MALKLKKFKRAAKLVSHSHHMAIKKKPADVTLKVLVRCRPFSEDDLLGMFIRDGGKEKSEIQIVNGEHGSRYAFQESWWSAYGYERHMQPDETGYAAQAGDMELISQETIYNNVGVKMLDLVLNGEVVVIFAYGLSGSGKTFTVFGPDMITDPEAWYKSSIPHKSWGLFPRVAYDIFKRAKPGWKISIKYFQNVVDTVRDLLSMQATEKYYKEGMHKDASGFIDIKWCRSEVLESWEDLIKVFTRANDRKSISPTQFNHASTRGHCILIFQVERPHPQDSKVRQTGRMYISDLAGAEPAGDVVYARYDRIECDDGSIEYKYIGPHPNKEKTKRLQNQGKKINLSLSEMTQYFHKMALAIKKKKLKNGASIPGCNSFFLGKFLKETLLHAHTYLCAAVRPEAKFERYNISTLEFAKSASLVKLGPQQVNRKQTSHKHTELLGHMGEMEEKLKKLEEQNKLLQDDDDKDEEQILLLKKQLADKEKELRDHVKNEHLKEQEEILKQVNAHSKVYEKSGITLLINPEMEGKFKCPYLINVDDDPYSNNRYVYLLSRNVTNFGLHQDIEPIIHQDLVENFCTIEVVTDDKETGSDSPSPQLTLIARDGVVHHNGISMFEDEAHTLASGDRIAFNGEIMMLVYPGDDKHGPNFKSAADAYAEYGRGVLESNKLPVGKGEDLKNAMFEKENEAEYLNKVVDRLTPLLTKAKRICKILNRSEIDLSVDVQAHYDTSIMSNSDTKKRAANHSETKLQIGIKATNTSTNHYTILDIESFKSTMSILEDEMRSLESAIDDGISYTVGKSHDPLVLFFDHMFEFAFITCPYKDLLVNKKKLSKSLALKSLVSPHKDVGTIDMEFTFKSKKREIVVGKPFQMDMEIKKVKNLQTDAQQILCRSSFVNQHEFTTEVVEESTKTKNAFDINYSQSYQVSKMLHKQVEFLNNSQLILILCVNLANPNPREDNIISTASKDIVKNLIYSKEITSSLGDELILAKRISDYKQKSRKLEAEISSLNTKYQDGIEQLKKEKEELILGQNSLKKAKEDLILDQTTMKNNFNNKLKQLNETVKNKDVENRGKIEKLETKLSVMKKEHDEEIERLKKEKKDLLEKDKSAVSYLNELHAEELQKKSNKIQNLIKQHRLEMEKKEKRYDIEMQELKNKFNKEKMEHVQQIKEIEDNYTNEKKRLRERFEGKETDDIHHLNDDFNEKIKLLKSRYDKQISNLNESHTNECNKLQNRFNDEKKRLNKHFNEEKQELKEFQMQNINQLKRVQEKVKSTHGQEVHELNDQIKTLKSQHLDQMDNLKVHFEDELETLRGRNKELQKELNVSTLNFHSSDEKIVNLTKKCDELRIQLNKESEVRVKQTSKLKKVEHMLSNKTEESTLNLKKCNEHVLMVKKLTKAMDDSERKINIEMEMRKSLENEIARNKVSIQVTNKDLDEARKLLKERASELHVNELKLEENRHAIELKNKIVDRIKVEIEKQKNIIKISQENEEKYNLDARKLRHDLGLLQHTVNASKVENTQLRARISNMTIDAKSISQEYEMTKSELEKNIHNLNIALKSLTDKKETLEKDVLTKSEKIAILSQNTDRLKAETNRYKEEIIHNNKLADKRYIDNEKTLKKSIDHLENNVKRLQEQCSILSRKLQDCKDRNQESQKVLEHSVREKESNLRILEKEKDHLNHMISTLQVTNKKNFAQSEQEIALEKAKCARLEEDIKEMQALEKDEAIRLNKCITELEDERDTIHRSMEADRRDNESLILSLESDMEKRNHKIEAMGKDFMNLHNQMEEERKDYQKRIKELRESQIKLNREYAHNIKTLQNDKLVEKRENNRLKSAQEQNESIKTQEMDALRRQISNLKLVHGHDIKQKSNQIDDLKTQLKELNESHELELRKYQDSYKVDHDKMLRTMNELRGDIISTRQTMGEEMEEKIEAERLRFNLNAETERSDLKAKHQKEILEYQSKERGWNAERRSLQHQISEARSLAQRTRESAIREEELYQSKNETLHEKIKTLAAKQVANDEVKESLEAAKKEMASITHTQIGYESSQHKRYTELETKYLQTSNALQRAKAELKLKVQEQRTNKTLSLSTNASDFPEFRQLRNERDKAVVEAETLKAEIKRQKEYTESIITKYRQEKQDSLTELGEMSTVLLNSQEKWDHERKKLRDSYKYVQEAWTKTKLELDNQRLQQEMGNAKMTAEKNLLKQSMFQAKREANSYKEKFKGVLARSENEKDTWRNKEMKLKSRLHYESTRVKDLENHVTTSIHERDNALDKFREARQLELDASSAYQNLLRKSMEDESEKQRSLLLNDNLALDSYAVSSLNDSNMDVSTDILKLREELDRLNGMSHVIDNRRRSNEKML